MPTAKPTKPFTAGSCFGDFPGFRPGLNLVGFAVGVRCSFCENQTRLKILGIVYVPSSAMLISLYSLFVSPGGSVPSTLLQHATESSSLVLSSSSSLWSAGLSTISISSSCPLYAVCATPA